MTDQPVPSQSSLGDHIELTLRQNGKLTNGEVMTHVVVLARSVRALPDGRLYSELHRIYASGEIEGSTERQMYNDALDDSRAERNASL